MTEAAITESSNKTEIPSTGLQDYPGFMDGNQPLSAKSSYSYVPTKRPNVPKESYYNNGKKDTSHSTYDRLFNWTEGYNNKLHRCDREHAKCMGINIIDEETPKKVPTCVNSDYGHRLEEFKDPPGRAHVKVGYVGSEFYRQNGINLDGNTEGL